MGLWGVFWKVISLVGMLNHGKTLTKKDAWQCQTSRNVDDSHPEVEDITFYQLSPRTRERSRHLAL